jgi:dolichol-phosphate mannosyltransferase
MLSIVIPACNEASTLAEIIARVRRTALAGEIIVVDDGSTDATPELLRELEHSGVPALRSFRHVHRRGKGAAIRTALAAVSGDLVLVQDADLEYSPEDYPALLAPFADPAVQAVYGSRNLRADNGRSNFAFYWGGRFLSVFANALFGGQLTDEATGYKVVRTSLLRTLDLRADGFEFCAELTGKLLGRGVRIVEVPISYRPRSRRDGKKIRWSDGLVAIWTMVKLRLGAGRKSKS